MVVASVPILEIVEVAPVVPPVTISELVNATSGTIILNVLAESSLELMVPVAPEVVPVITSLELKLLLEATVIT